MGLGSTKSKTTNVQTVTPEVQQFLNQAISGAGGLLPQGTGAISNQLNPMEAANFFQQNIAAPQREQFMKTTIPGIQQAGANLGAKGGSSLDRHLAQAARGFESDLSRQLAGFQQQGQQQGLQNLFQLAGIGSQNQFQPIFQPGGPGMGEQLGAGLLQALPYILAA